VEPGYPVHALGQPDRPEHLALLILELNIVVIFRPVSPPANDSTPASVPLRSPWQQQPAEESSALRDQCSRLNWRARHPQPSVSRPPAGAR